MTASTPAKQTLYRTAVSRVSACGISEGDFVAIRHYLSRGDQHYYMVTDRRDNGDIDTGIVLPDHHLKCFCL